MSKVVNRARSAVVQVRVTQEQLKDYHRVAAAFKASLSDCIRALMDDEVKRLDEKIST